MSITLSITRIIGLVLLIAGIALTTRGAVASNSAADDASRFFRGRLTQNTTWYILGGIATAAVGPDREIASTVHVAEPRRNSDGSRKRNLAATDPEQAGD